MDLSPKRLFLLDACGALFSAFMLGIVLAQLEPYFGMPADALHFLSGAASIFATYSFFCYFRAKENWRPLLRGIAIVNLIYCAVSIGFVVYFHQKLTGLGFAYFTLEILVIIALVRLEMKAVNASKTAKQEI